MALAPGTRVGPYDVTSLLGTGGMGEVFRAHDARLKRDVALKVLPASAVGDPHKRSRFDREAQVLASLNHPSIAQVFGVEMHGDEPVIVMEIVEGSTLADRIKGGPLPLDEALPIAVELCDGLEAAHGRNIVHRDLKPANVKVRPDGTIKILDFGIARVLASDAAVDTSNSPTILGGSTDAGIILGTAAYMSPEQARGRAIDKRADIWAFGCILYEMLTGAAAFSGESTTDILADVVKKDPDWTRLPPGTPDRLIELMKRCLQKNPKDRLRDIADARFELDQAARAGRSSSEGLPSTKAAPGSTSKGSPLARLGLFAAGAAVSAAALLLTPLARPRTVDAPPASRATIDLPASATIVLGRGSSVILSPDGRTLVYVGRANGKTQLYVRPLDRFESLPLAGTDDATNPFFSPDGRWIGFFAAEKLKKVSLDGGAPVTVSDIVNARGEAWAPDDTIYVTPHNSAGVHGVSARGGKLQPVTTLSEGHMSHRWPRVLPDGSTMLFAVWNDNGFEFSSIVAQKIGAPDQKVVVETGGGYPRYIRDREQQGYLVYARAEGLLAVPFDETTLTVRGQAVPLVDGVLTNLSGGAHFDLSSNGTLVYVPGSADEAERELTWMSLDGRATPSRKVRGLTRTWKLSPDGTRVARNNGGGPSDVWVEHLGNALTTRVSNAPERFNFNPVWSHDGKHVIYGQGLQGGDLFRRAADGSGVEERLTSYTGVPTRVSPYSVSPDGKWLSYYLIDSVTGFDIWIRALPPAGARSDEALARPFVKTNGNEGNAAFSPDGRWLAYQSNESGRFETYIRSFPDGQQTLRVSAQGGVSPIWSPKGDELYFRAFDGKLIAASMSAAPAFQDKLRVLFDASKFDTNFAVAPDGRLLMMPLLPSELSATRINVIFNLLTELRQRVK